MTDSATANDYALDSPVDSKPGVAPDLPYRPPMPRSYRPRIGMIGCGGITEAQLTAYRDAGLDVVAFVDLDREAAVKRRDAFYPDAEVYTDRHEMLRRDDIDVVDIPLHPAPRAAAVEDALKAGKHVLSQKPFAVDMATAQRLTDLADRQGRLLAVNQNGRWAPHVAYARAAIEAGLLGELSSIDTAMHWDHNWVVGTAFNEIPHLILYDFAVHWFDMFNCYAAGRDVKRVTASVTPLRGQTARPPLGAHALIEADGLMGTLSFNGNTKVGSADRTLLVGSAGVLESRGPNINEQTVTLHKADGSASPTLAGKWFNDGLAGAMGELLCAIEDNRQPSHSAANNHRTLELTFAAMASVAAQGQPVAVGSVAAIDPKWLSYA